MLKSLIQRSKIVIVLRIEKPTFRSKWGKQIKNKLTRPHHNTIFMIIHHHARNLGKRGNVSKT